MNHQVEENESSEPVVTSGRGGWRSSLAAHAGAIVLGAVMLAVLVLPMRYANHLHMHNEAIRIYAAEALVHHGTACLNPVFDEYYPGFLDAGLVPNVDAALRDDCYLLDKAPLLTWLAVPVVWLTAPLGLGGPSGHAQLTWWLVLLWVAVPLTAALLFLRARMLASGLSAPVVELVVAATALGTALTSYGGLYYGHGLAAALVTTGVLLLFGPARIGEQDPRRGVAAAAGACLGAAVLTEYPAAIVVVLTAALLLCTPGGRRRLPWFILGGLPALGALLLWNALVFGGPLALSYGFKQHDGFAEVISTGSFGIHLLGLRHVPRLLFGPERGLLFLSPWLLTALAGLAVMFSRERTGGQGLLRWWFVGVLPAALLCIGSFEDWEAGRGMGPRHWVLLMPLLAVPAAFAIEGLGRLRLRTWMAPVVLGLMLLSVLLHVLSAAVFPHFPQSIRNPLAEIVLPVLVLDGPATTVLGESARWPVLTSLLACAAALSTATGLRWLKSVEVPGRGALLSVVVAVTGFMLLVAPHTPGPEGRLLVLQEQRLVMELRDSTENESLLRRRIERLSRELEGQGEPSLETPRGQP